MLKRLLVLGVLLGLLQGYGLSQGLEQPIVVTQIPFPDPETVPAPLSETERSKFGEKARIILVSSGGDARVLTEGFASAVDPNVSFDGKRMLFAGKRRPEDQWNIFEMALDGSDARQITRDVGNCRSPVYQSTFYTIVSPEPWYQITFVSDAPGEINEQGDGED